MQLVYCKSSGGKVTVALCHILGNVSLYMFVLLLEGSGTRLIDPTSGHLGRVHTMYRIKERFMWTGMYKDVKELVRF